MLSLDQFAVIEEFKDEKGEHFLKLQHRQDHTYHLAHLRPLDPYEATVATESLALTSLQCLPLEEELRQREEFYKTVLENAFDSILIRDVQGKIKYVSPNVKNFGFEPEWFVKDDFGRAVRHPEDLEELHSKFEQVTTTPGAMVTMLQRLRLRDGEYHTFEVVARNMLDNPAVNGVVINFRDVTSQQKVERELLKKERYFRTLIETSFDVTLTRGADGTITYISPSAEAVLGFRPDEVVGTLGLEMFPAEVLPVLARDADELFKNPSLVRHHEMKMLRKDGKHICVETIAKNLLTDEAVRGIVITFRDITERKAAEELLQDYNKTLQEEVEKRTRSLENQNRELETLLSDLKNAQSQLIQSEKMASLGQLTAGIAHEINNPINFVSANIDPLKTDFEELRQLLAMYADLHDSDDLQARLAEIDSFREQIDLEYILEEISALLHGIEEGAMRTKEIVVGLKNFSRVGESDLKKVDIREGIDSTLMLLKNKLKNRITVHKQYSDLPLIECFPGKINQVFMNILNNAIEAIEGKGNIVISTRHDENCIYVAIRDSGPGMSEEVKNRIFEPFFTTKPLGEGTGLGLSVSYGIIQQHNGTIEVISREGQGCEFVISLPIEAKAGG